MKQLNNWQSALFMVGALLMVCGAALSIFRWHYFPYLYAVGAIAFVCMQLLQRYDGPNVTLRRLRRIVVLSDVLLLLAAVLMFATQENPFGIDRLYYLNYVHNNWVVVLLLAAILQLYTSYRIGHELEKEAKKL
jgi:hypothetical protein